MNKPVQNSLRILFTVFSLLFALGANNAKAAVTYWDPQGTTGANPFTGSMVGTWESNLWSSSTAGLATPIAWIEGNAACFAVHSGFGTPPYTVTMNSNHTVAGIFDGPLTPNSSQVTIVGTGQMILPAGLDAFDVINASDGSLGWVTVSNTITGPGIITCEGSSQIFLNGSNNWTGGTTLGYSGSSFSGIVNFNSSNSFGVGSIMMTNGNGSALVVEGTSPVTVTNSFRLTQAGNLNIVGNPAGVTFSGPFLLGPGPVGLGAGGTGNLVIIPGVLSGGAAGISKFNPSVLQLGGANTFSGGSGITAGTLQLANPQALGYTVSTLTAGAAIDLNGTTNINTALILNGTGIGGVGGLVNSNVSTTAVLAPANSVVGAVVTAVGASIATPVTVTLSGGGGSGATATADLGVTAASFTITPGTQKYSAVPSIVISGGGQANDINATATCALSAGSGSVLSATVTVTAAGYGFTSVPTVAFSGGTVSTAGTAPTITANATHFTLRSLAITGGGSGYTSAPTVAFSSGTATATTRLSSVNLATTTSVGGPGSIILSNVVSGTGAAGLSKVGAGTVTLAAANTYTGPTVVSNGILSLSGSGALAAASSVTVLSGTTFDVSGLASPTYTLGSSATLTAVGLTSVPAVLNGAPSGTVSLGTRPVTLSFVPTAFTGDSANAALNIPQGTLALNNNTFTVTNASVTALGAGTYTLVTCPGGITGTPSPYVSVKGAGLVAGLGGTILVNGNEVDLVVSTLPAFSALTASQSDVYGTPSITLTGTLSAPGPVYPNIGETVYVTINGNIQTTTISDNTGDFSINYNMATTPVTGSPFAVTYGYPGNVSLSLSAATDATTALTVTKAPATVSANAQSKTYGQVVTFGAGSTLFTTNGLMNGETIGTVTLAVSGSGGAAAAAVSGSPYTITPSAATGGTFAAANYTITYVTNSLTVNPAPLTVTATSSTRFYGATNPIVLAVTYSPFVNGQTLGTSDIGGSPSLVTTAVTNSPIGTYDITNTIGTLTSTNYSFVSFVNGTVTINPLAVNLTGTRPYDGTSNVIAAILTITTNYDGTNLTLSGSANLTDSGAGVKTIADFTGLTLGGTAATNYTLTNASGSVTVTTVPLSITANPQSKTYGSALSLGNSAFSVGSGLVSPETVTAVTLAASGGTAATDPVSGSPYTITPSAATGAGGFLAANYAITYNTNSLTVNPAPLTVTGNNSSRDYGSANPVFGVTYSGFVNSQTLGTSDVGGSPSLVTGAVTNSPIGVYDITNTIGTLTSTNYSFSFVDGMLTINPLAVNLTGTRPYDGTSNAVAAILTITTNYDGTNLTLSGSANLAGSDAGVENIADFTGLTLGGTAGTNYTLTGASGSVTITTVPLSITANPRSKTYGSALSLGTSAFSVGPGLVSPETVTAVTLVASGGTAATDPVSGSPYTITPSAATGAGGFLAANYAITYNTNSLTVNPLAVVLAGTRTYDGTADAAFGILSVTDAVGGDDVNAASGSVTLTSSAVGTNAITSAGTLALGGTTAGNYTLTGLSGSVIVSNPHTPFTITSAALDNTKTNLVTVFQSVPGVVYQLLGSTNVTTPLTNWVSVGGPITAIGTATTNVTPISPGAGLNAYTYKDVQ